MKQLHNRRPTERQDVADRLRSRILAALSRVTSSGRVIPVLDGLRFVAITAVILVHLGPFVFIGGTGAEPGANVPEALRQMEAHWYTFALRQGGVGVQLFFTISGSILSLPFAAHYFGVKKKAVSLRAYFWRRVTRLEPPYLINLGVVFALIVLVKGASVSELLPHLAASAVYVHGFLWDSLPRINPLAWSLEIEVQFYILAPLLATIFKVRRRMFRRGLLLAGMTLPPWICTQFGYAPVIPNLVTEIQHFFAGFLLTDIYLVDWAGSSPQPRAGWDWIGLLAFLLIIPAASQPLVKKMVVPTLTLLAYLAAFQGIWLRRFFSNPWIATCGGMCYTIYLYHWVLLVGLGKVSLRFLGTGNPHVDLLVNTLLVVPAIFLISAVLFVVTEKPFMQRDWPQKLTDWTRARTSAPYGVEWRSSGHTSSRRAQPRAPEESSTRR